MEFKFLAGLFALLMVALVMVSVYIYCSNQRSGAKMETASLKEIAKYQSEASLKLFRIDYFKDVYVLICSDLDVWEAVFGRMIVFERKEKIIKFEEIKNYKKGRWIAYGTFKDIISIADFFQKLKESNESPVKYEQVFLDYCLYNKLLEVKDGKYHGNVGHIISYSQDKDEYIKDPQINYRSRYVFKQEILHIIFDQDPVYADMMTKAWDDLSVEQQKVFKLMLKSFGIADTTEKSTVIGYFMIMMQDIDRHFEGNPVFDWYYQEFLPADESKFVLDYCKKHKKFFESLRARMNNLTKDYEKKGMEYPIDWFE